MITTFAAWRAFISGRREGNDEALSLFYRAIELDPNMLRHMAWRLAATPSASPVAGF